MVGWHLYSQTLQILNHYLISKLLIVSILVNVLEARRRLAKVATVLI
jgi:hypothetical protein